MELRKRWKVVARYSLMMAKISLRLSFPTYWLLSPVLTSGHVLLPSVRMGSGTGALGSTRGANAVTPDELSLYEVSGLRTIDWHASPR